MKKVLSLLLLVSMVSVYGCSIWEKDKEKNSEKDNKTVSNESENVIKILNKEPSNTTYDQFINVEVGQTYKEVVKILGEPNKLSKSGDKYTYIWECNENKGLSLIVEDGIVTSKSQADLKEGTSNVTIDQYNQLKEGMTIEEVQAILGEGKLTFEEKTDDFIRKIYSFYNEDRSNIIINFRNDKLYSMTKNNLD